MCIGMPMQVIETGFGEALCVASDGSRRLIDTRLVGDVSPGAWVMVFIDAAREVISAEQAKQSADALEALALVMRGETNVDHLFADLVARDRPLPSAD